MRARTETHYYRYFLVWYYTNCHFGTDLLLATSCLYSGHNTISTAFDIVQAASSRVKVLPMVML